MAWTRRTENIRKRDWSELLEHWTELGGAGFDTAQALAGSLEQAVESTVPAEKLSGNNIHIVQLNDKTIFLSELVFSQIKANHVFVCATQRVATGNATWGVTDAYHATMLLMRSILSAFGIFVCRAHERNVLIDAFPWLGRSGDQKKFKRQHRNWQSCAAVISCTSKDFDQSDLYSLFQRVLNISTVPTEIWTEVVVRNIINTDKKHFSSSRNQLIYGSRFWFNPDDILGECLSLNWMNRSRRSISAYEFTKTGSSTEIDSYCDCWVLFLMSRRLHDAIYKSFVDSLCVFDYVESRQVELSIVGRQFSDLF
jgi:hypothetical protein